MTSLLSRIDDPQSSSLERHVLDIFGAKPHLKVFDNQLVFSLGRCCQSHPHVAYWVPLLDGKDTICPKDGHKISNCRACAFAHGVSIASANRATLMAFADQGAKNHVTRLSNRAAIRDRALATLDGLREGLREAIQILNDAGEEERAELQQAQKKEEDEESKVECEE